MIRKRLLLGGRVFLLPPVLLEPRPNTEPHSSAVHQMQPCVALARSARDGYRSLIGLNVFMNGSAGLDNLRESRRLLHRFADEAARAICRVYSVDLKHCLQVVRAYRRGYSKPRLPLPIGRATV